MGIVAKALLKSLKESARLAEAGLEPKAKDSPGQPAAAPPAAPLPAPPGKTAGSPSSPAAKPDPVRVAPTAPAPDRKPERLSPAGASAPAAPPAPAAKPLPKQGTPRPVAQPRKKTLPAARKIEPDMVSLASPDGAEAELFKLLRTRILFLRPGAARRGRSLSPARRRKKANPLWPQTLRSTLPKMWMSTCSWSTATCADRASTPSSASTGSRG